MPSPTDRRYSESHEWFKADGDVVTMGITQFAVNELTDITYAELKDSGTSLSPGDSIGEVESVKATSDVYCSVPGEIVEVNEELESDPAALNNDPYGSGWLVKIKVSDPSAHETLMTAAEYDKKHGS